MKRVIVGLLLALALLSGCGGDGDRLVVDDGGIASESDVMIAEAAENTRLMEAQK